MDKPQVLLICILLLSLGCDAGSSMKAESRAQKQRPKGHRTPGSVLADTVVEFGEGPDDAGSGPLAQPQRDDVPPEQRKKISEQNRLNAEQLRAEGKIPVVSGAAVIKFAWPLSYTPQLSEWGVHQTFNFVDHNSGFPGKVKDYNGGARTYDTDTGYNHQGIDINLYPWAWQKMYAKKVSVVAAAPGTILLKQDGNFDASCNMGSGAANVINLLHADGSISMYFHLKKSSLTTKPFGASVAAGEFLGNVGSSGSSTAPHLHFEVYNPSGKLIDPFWGSSNTTTTESWWATQRPYYDSAINKITTGSKEAVFPTCPNQETPNEQRVFTPGQNIYYTVYYRDLRKDQKSQYMILRPNGTLSNAWSHTSPDTYTYGSNWFWTYPAPFTLGTWKFQVNYNGKTYTHNYEVCATKPGIPALTVPLNGATLSQRKVLLDWNVASCTDTYTVFLKEGSSSGTNVAIAINQISSWTTSPLTPGKTYYWHVQGVNSLGVVKSGYRSFKVSSTAK